MTDDVEVFFEPSESGCVLESLIRSRVELVDCPELLSKLDEVIGAELDLALMGAEKAKSVILKANTENKVRPIKWTKKTEKKR